MPKKKGRSKTTKKTKKNSRTVVTVPRSRPNPRKGLGNGLSAKSHVFPGNDFLGTVATTTAAAVGDVMKSWEVSPWAGAPRLSWASWGWKKWRPISIVVEYDPIATQYTSSAGGQLLGYFETDLATSDTEGTGEQRLQRATAAYGEKPVSIYERRRWTMPIDPKAPDYWTKKSSFTGSGLFFAMPARFVLLAASAIEASKALGNLNVYYQVAFTLPAINYAPTSAMAVLGSQMTVLYSSDGGFPMEMKWNGTFTQEVERTASNSINFYVPNDGIAYFFYCAAETLHDTTTEPAFIVTSSVNIEVLKHPVYMTGAGYNSGNRVPIGGIVVRATGEGALVHFVFSAPIGTVDASVFFLVGQTYWSPSNQKQETKEEKKIRVASSTELELKEDWCKVPPNTPKDKLILAEKIERCKALQREVALLSNSTTSTSTISAKSVSS